ncbi:MAG: ComF family protein [Geminicoccaceae bacterium]|nr:ComF family protein [Geminicoccaceae bacterium]MCB9944064.1 ComF family protein [Geminicoccaceae bacterium]
MMVNAVIPARCLACSRIIDIQGELCEVCWNALRFIKGDVCRICGRPFGGILPHERLCGDCMDEPPLYDRARAPLLYEGVGRRLVLRLKHGGHIEGARTLARWMASVAGPLIDDTSLLVPVPAHRWRLWSRGFNQAALLAGHVGRITGVPYLPQALERRQATVSQQGLGASERRVNITPAAFAMTASGAARIDGHGVILVDDVLTTGSTVNACAAVLRRAGARSVDVLTLARVAREESAPI